MISIRYALPTAVFDSRELQGIVTVHFADGTERYTVLGANQEEHPEPGEVVFSDATGLVIARRWCWRQSESSAAQLDTSSAIIVIEAHHTNAHQEITAALDDLLELLRKYVRGNFTQAILDKDHPAIMIDMKY